ncbi:MAG: hypothetical protein IRY85_19525 [Micromonosporaceae bacterium]|nr:hypothetical protein [Micromonosporaceae bacterium]
MTERKRLLLRLDPDVYERIARWAADDLRSVNAQIEYALRWALRAAGRAGPGARDQEPVDPDDAGAPDDPAAPAGVGSSAAVQAEPPVDPDAVPPVDSDAESPAAAGAEPPSSDGPPPAGAADSGPARQG